MGFPNHTFFDLFSAGTVVMQDGKLAFIPAFETSVIEFLEEIDFVKEYWENWIKELIGYS